MEQLGIFVDEAHHAFGKALAKDMGVQLEIVNTTNSARIPNLLSNKVDLIISSLSPLSLSLFFSLSFFFGR